ncbi:unnamed protein product [Amoebophrya sp. A120]|nr:unnamed protein product [Amoebophrya sp. A120]|eukprot:GSA120T00018337001.1
MHKNPIIAGPSILRKKKLPQVKNFVPIFCHRAQCSRPESSSVLNTNRTPLGIEDFALFQRRVDSFILLATTCRSKLARPRTTQRKMSDTPAAGGRLAVGAGLRTAGRRPGRQEASKSKDTVAGQPTNNLLRFSSEGDGTGLKVGPVTVLVMALSYMVIVVFLHIMTKFKTMMMSSGGGEEL